MQYWDNFSKLQKPFAILVFAALNTCKHLFNTKSSQTPKEKLLIQQTRNINIIPNVQRKRSKQQWKHRSKERKEKFKVDIKQVLFFVQNMSNQARKGAMVTCTSL